MAETILVIGATGMLGEPVVRRLVEDGHEVRAMSRDADRARARLGDEIECVAGDVDDPASLDRAMEGCTGVHVSLAGGADWDLERRGATNAAKAAKRQGLKRLTYISGASAIEENCWFPMTKAKVEAEAAIRESGVPFTIFKATFFMEALVRFVMNGRALVMGKQPNPFHLLAAKDYARMVSTAFTTPEAANKALYIYGPEAMTFKEALTRYCAICSPDTKVVTIPFWVLWLLARVPSRVMLREVGLPMMRYFSKVGEAGDATEANELLGAPTTTLEAWSEARMARARAEPGER